MGGRPADAGRPLRLLPDRRQPVAKRRGTGAAHHAAHGEDARGPHPPADVRGAAARLAAHARPIHPRCASATGHGHPRTMALRPVQALGMIHPERAVAVLRIIVGAWFLKAVWTKLTLGFAAGVIPFPAVSARFLAFQPKRVAEFAAGNPVGWYKDFLEQTVLPHAQLFGTLQ